MKTLMITIFVLMIAGMPATAQKDTLQKKKIYKAWISVSGEKGKKKGILYQVKDSSLLLSNSKHIKDYYTGNFKTTPFDANSIDKIKIRRMRNVNRGAFIGMAVGFAAGMITGAVLGHNAPSALWVGSWGIAAGAIVGASIGSIKISIPITGSQEKFEKNKGKLMSYAIKNNPVRIVPGYFSRLTTVVKDTDGNSYHTFSMAGQVWLASNLRVKHYRNGDSVENIRNANAWKTTTRGAVCNYQNDSLTAKTTELLYNWNAVNDDRGICPAGWHVPTLTEWSSLVTCLGGESGSGKKLTEPIPAITGNLSEDPFALPGGFRYGTGEFSSAKGNSYQWWTSSSADQLKAKAFYMGNSDGGIIFSDTDKRSGLPVRCIRD